MSKQPSSDERTTPQGGQPTPPGVRVERQEGRVAAANESVGGEISVEKYSNQK
jgi:hypothetical protein